MYHRLRLRPILGPLNIFGILALAGIAGPIVLILADLVAALSEPGYNLVRDSISILALTSMGWVQTIGFLVIGLMVEVFVAGLLFNIRGRWGFGFSIGLLACFGFGLLLMGAFQMDPPSEAKTIHGTIHGLTAAGSFWVFFVSVLLLIPSLRHDPYWKDIFPYTVAAGALALVLGVGQFWLSAETSWFGLYERVIVVNAVIWVEVMAVRLLRLSLGKQAQIKKADPV